MPACIITRLYIHFLYIYLIQKTMKTYKPTDNTLLKLGFQRYGLFHWFYSEFDQLEYMQLSDNSMAWYFCFNRIYPTSKQEIETIIRLLTPPNE